MRGLMLQGTSSDSGKSFIVTGLCRLLSGMGIRVCPFKSQNMSNNSYVTHDGKEISIAQALQAKAAGLVPEVFMNPILLKPRHNCSSEIILNGKVYAHTTKNYRAFTQTLGIQAVRESLAHIAANFDAVIIEGAGSPAEINLNAHEIVNMRIAREADVPVILVADVDRGGSLASVIGTLELLGNDRERVKGIIFNKFRGDIELFKSAVTWTENHTGIKVLGVLPFLENVNLSGEDSMNLHGHISTSEHAINIGIMKFPGISNFSDFDAFTLEPDVNLLYVDENISVKNFHELDAIILPGTKNTFSAMNWLKKSGLDFMIKNFHGHIFGICGGLQIMGNEILDPMLIENDTFSKIYGLGLLPLSTNFTDDEKITRQISGKISGYEIHYGKTNYYYSDEFMPLCNDEGMMTKNFRLACTYLHGIFSNDNFRNNWLNSIRRQKNYGTRKTHTANINSFDAIAEALRTHIDIPDLLQYFSM